MDHIGFKVESVETLKEDVERIAADNPRLAPAPVGTGAEGKALLEAVRGAPARSASTSMADLRRHPDRRRCRPDADARRTVAMR